MSYLESIIRQFQYYKSLGEKAIGQLKDEDLYWQYNSESNSIAIIVKHLHGNMLSRWTDFLNTDGEKEWRNRDDEFKSDIRGREQLMNLWNQGWDCFFDAINSLKDSDLEKIIFIRNEGHSVTDAINRQLAHYSYHIGQIVYIAKLCNENFVSLSIPRNKSIEYNTGKFEQSKGVRHFTDEFLKKDNP